MGAPGDQSKRGRGSGPSFPVSFFRLIEAFSHEGCPVCFCLKVDTLRYLDGLLYEQVNDPATRASLRASLGFCNWHAWMTRGIPACNLGIAIINEDILRDALGRLRRMRVRLNRGWASCGWLSRLLSRRLRNSLSIVWKRKAICPACQVGREAESRYLFYFLEFLKDPQFERAFDRSAGLCLPHLLQMVELGPTHPNSAIVVERTERKWHELQARLKSFIAKNSFASSEPITPEDARSLILALELLAGGMGIFGNDLHREASVRNRIPPPPTAFLDFSPSPTSDSETLQFENKKLKLQVDELRSKFSEASSRAASLHHRLWETLETRKVLEMNLSGERAHSRGLERTVEKLRKEVERLKAQAGTDSPEKHE